MGERTGFEIFWVFLVFLSWSPQGMGFEIFWVFLVFLSCSPEGMGLEIFWGLRCSPQVPHKALPYRDHSIQLRWWNMIATYCIIVHTVLLDIFLIVNKVHHDLYNASHSVLTHSLTPSLTRSYVTNVTFCNLFVRYIVIYLGIWELWQQTTRSDSQHLFQIATS